MLKRLEWIAFNLDFSVSVAHISGMKLVEKVRELWHWAGPIQTNTNLQIDDRPAHQAMMGCWLPPARLHHVRLDQELLLASRTWTYSTLQMLPGASACLTHQIPFGRLVIVPTESTTTLTWSNGWMTVLLSTKSFSMVKVSISLQCVSFIIDSFLGGLSNLKNYLVFPVPNCVQFSLIRWPHYLEQFSAQHSNFYLASVTLN